MAKTKTKERKQAAAPAAAPPGGGPPPPPAPAAPAVAKKKAKAAEKLAVKAQSKKPVGAACLVGAPCVHEHGAVAA